MLPEFCSDDYVITWRPFFWKPKEGDVVIARHPKFGGIIKRVKCVTSNGHYFLEGDNKALSTKSEALGVFHKSQFVGRVVWRLTNPVVRKIPGKAMNRGLFVGFFK